MQESQYYGIFQPKQDITTFELAQLIPYLIPGGRGLTSGSVKELGNAARHFILFTNEIEFKKFIETQSVVPRD